jgi:RNA polymerase sigma-70 factor (ECF subfamily)
VTREPEKPSSDGDLIASIADGDLEAAAELYDRHAPVLLALAVRIVRDRAEAEDVIHDAFVTLHSRALQYSADRGSVIAWLVTLVRNLSIDRTRRRERRGVILRRVAHEEIALPPRDPEAQLSDAATHARVLRALSRLPLVQRQTLEVAFFEGLSYPEIAEREGVPLGTIKSRAARALMSLRDALAAEDVKLADILPDPK